jgi:hypothetical protein
VRRVGDRVVDLRAALLHHSASLTRRIPELTAHLAARKG